MAKIGKKSKNSKNIKYPKQKADGGPVDDIVPQFGKRKGKVSIIHPLTPLSLDVQENDLKNTYSYSQEFLDNWYKQRSSKFGLNYDLIKPTIYDKELDVTSLNMPYALGQFYGEDNGISVRPELQKDKSTFIHELSHKVDKQSPAVSNAILGLRNLVNPVNEKTTEEYLQYLSTPTEIHSRLMELRNAIKKDPKKPWTYKHTDQLYKKMDEIPNSPVKHTLNQILEVLKPDVSLERLMNSVVSNDVEGVGKGIQSAEAGGPISPLFPLLNKLATSLFAKKSKNSPGIPLAKDYSIASFAESNNAAINSLYEKALPKEDTTKYSEDNSIRLTEGLLRGAKIPRRLISDASKVGKKYEVDPFDILGIAAKESTYGYGPFGGARRDETGNISARSMFTMNDIPTHTKIPKTYEEFVYDKGDRSLIELTKNNDGFFFVPKDEDAKKKIYSDPKLVGGYKEYLTQFKNPGMQNVLEEVAKRIKTRGISSYNPGQKNYAELVDKYKEMLKNNKTKILPSTNKLGGFVPKLGLPKFEQGGEVYSPAMNADFNFVLPTSYLTPKFSQMGLNSYFNDPQMLPQAGLGGFLKKVGKSIWGGIKASGDNVLSLAGMPNVIQNSALDQNKAASAITGIAGGLGRSALNIFAPGVGMALGALSGGVNSFTGGSGANPLGGFNPFGGGSQDFSAGAYNSGSMLAGLQPSWMMNSSGATSTGAPQFNAGNMSQVLQMLQGVGNPFGGTPGFAGNQGLQPRYYAEGGSVEQQAPPAMTPIQTEKGEMFIHLDTAITPVNAKKLHKHMDDDEVTDIVPEGTYVASADKGIKMTKDQADDIVMGIKTSPYEENKKGKIPEKQLFSELFGKGAKKLTPAEMAMALLKKFPTVDKSSDFTKNDIFTELTNQENIESRLPWLQQLIEFNESKRQKDPGELSQFKHGGKVVDKSNKSKIVRLKDLEKHGPGDWVGDAIGIGATALPFLQSIFGKNNSGIDPLAQAMLTGSAPLNTLGLTQNVRANQNALGQGITDFTGLGQNLNNFATMQAGAQIAGRALQDTTFERFNPTSQLANLNNFNTRTPNSFIDALSTPKFNLNALASTLGPRGFNTFGAQLVGQQNEAKNNAVMNQFNQNRNMDFNIMGQKNNLDSFTQQFNIGQGEKQQAAKNAQTAGIFGDIGSLYNRYGDIQSQILPITTQFNMQRANLEGQIPLGVSQNMMNIGSVLASMQDQGQSEKGGNFKNLWQMIFGEGKKAVTPSGPGGTQGMVNQIGQEQRQMFNNNPYNQRPELSPVNIVNPYRHLQNCRNIDAYGNCLD